MLAKRVATAVLLAAVGLPALYFGGLFYLLLIALFLGVAAWEYVRIFRTIQIEPSEIVVVGGVLGLLAARSLVSDWAAAGAVLTMLILLALTVHLLAYERGRERAAVDFAATIAGIAYLGWIGAYLVDLRSLPDGLWWLLLVLPSVWLADSAAYFVGIRFGRNKLCPRLSPKKTWEGYWAGVVAGMLGGVLFAWLWHRIGGLDVTLLEGAILGLVLSLLTTLGDLGESLFKRQAGIKDSSNIFPGHGGAFDRIDSWLWAAVLGYYLICWFLL
ncbi:MAG: phosphatidate cytidylyltransferase [Anaerolineales bacterium]|nr:phosphatidate cytidylyltransferase [Anaerolineales bacterium]